MKGKKLWTTVKKDMKTEIEQKLFSLCHLDK